MLYIVLMRSIVHAVGNALYCGLAHMFAQAVNDHYLNNIKVMVIMFPYIRIVHTTELLGMWSRFSYGV